MTSLSDRIKKLPKADLHNHLIFGPSISSLKKQYPRSNLIIPEFYDGLEGMHDYIHNNIHKGISRKEDVIKYMELAIEDCISDNVVLLEASVDLNLIKHFDNSVDQLIEVVQVLKRKYKSNISFHPDIGINKNINQNITFADIKKCVNSRVFSGIDLYGQEKNVKLDHFTEIFEFAKSKNLKTKVHIGEFSDPLSIEIAIYKLNPDEIQHGISAARSNATMKLIFDRNIRLNICPESNRRLGAITDIREHPIRKLYNYGIKVTINTDDLLLFDATISDQFVDLISNSVFTFNEIDIIRQNGLIRLLYCTAHNS